MAINILYASDDNYAPIAGISITSLLENNKSLEDVIIYYLDDHISNENKDKLQRTVDKYSRKIEFIDIDPYLSIMKDIGARVWFNGSMCAYARLFVEDIFSEKNLDKILYLDCDTVVNSSIEELYHYDLKGHVCAAVCDYISAGIRKIDGLKKNEYYFNSGVLLIDLKNWKNRNVQSTILNHMRTVRAQYPFVDQDIINCVLHGKIEKLPMKYNVFPYYYDFSLKEIHFMYGLNANNQYSLREYREGLGSPEKGVIYHYTATFHGKPWASGNDNPAGKIWEKYYILSEWNGKLDFPKHELSAKVSYQYQLFKKAPRVVFLILQKFMATMNMNKLIKQYRDN